MEILSRLINNVDQNPESILVMRQQTEQRLSAHQHDKAQLLLVYGGIAYLQTETKDFYIPSNHYIWIPKNYPHNLMFNTQDLYIINIYFPDENHWVLQPQNSVIWHSEFFRWLKETL